MVKSEVAEWMPLAVADILSADINEVTLESKLSEFGADSLDRNELVVTIEEEFEIEIPEGVELTTLETVGDWVRLIEKLKIRKDA